MSKGQHLGEFEHFVLLALLRVGREGYGMTVRREIEETTGRNVSIGSVYATLERLETKGYLSSQHIDPGPDRGGKPRRVYSVTRAGLRALDETREALAKMWNGVSTKPARGTR